MYRNVSMNNYEVHLSKGPKCTATVKNMFLPIYIASLAGLSYEDSWKKRYNKIASTFLASSKLDQIIKCVQLSSLQSYIV